MNQDTLASCPFCANPLPKLCRIFAHQRPGHAARGRHIGYRVICYYCHARMDQVKTATVTVRDARDAAIERWNVRADVGPDELIEGTRPCPICRGLDLSLQEAMHEPVGWNHDFKALDRIECAGCGLRVTCVRPLYFGDSMHMARVVPWEAWNRRDAEFVHPRAYQDAQRDEVLEEWRRWHEKLTRLERFREMLARGNGRSSEHLTVPNDEGVPR